MKKLKELLGFITRTDLNGQGLTPLHYLVGGIVGVFIVKLIYGEVSLITGILAFIFWPFVFAFGFLVLLIKIGAILIGLIF